MYINKIEQKDTETNSWNLSHLIADKCVKIHIELKIASSTNVPEEIEYLHVDEWK